MGNKLGIMGLVLALTVVAIVVDFAVTYEVSLGLLYFIPIGLCAWFFSRSATLALCVVVAVVRSVFMPNPCAHYVHGTHVTAPHLCYEYVVGTILRLIFYGLWGMVLSLVRNQRESIERLGWESLTDSLTGLFNRRYLQAKLKEEKARADRHKRPFSILMADIDHFKDFNDGHGHHKGDQLLVKVANELRENVREIDVVCRYGGEEFLMVLPETDGPHAEVVAERVRLAVAGSDLGSGSPLTISIGVASYPTDASSPELAILEADAALYQAKAGGRNRVCRAPSRADTPS